MFEGILVCGYEPSCDNRRGPSSEAKLSSSVATVYTVFVSSGFALNQDVSKLLFIGLRCFHGHLKWGSSPWIG